EIGGPIFDTECFMLSSPHLSPRSRLIRFVSTVVLVLAFVVVFFGLSCPVIIEDLSAPAPSSSPAVSHAPPVVASPQPELPAETEQFSIIWLSDTQTIAYFEDDRVFQAMGEWIMEQEKPLNVRYIIQTGDLVDNGYVQKQWDSFNVLLNQFYGKIPYLTIAGNHDLGVKLQEYDAYSSQPFVKSIPKEQSFKDGQAVYAEFQAGGQDFLILGAGWGAELSSTVWMNEVLRSHPDHVAILMFHYYIKINGSITNQSDVLRDRIVASNPNVRLVLSGHVRGSGYRLEEFDDDGDGEMDCQVHAMLYNYQNYPEYNTGQLRVLTFDTETRDIRVFTYSPFTKRYYSDGHFKSQEFVLEDAF
ncbi:MAG: metallophosphoesterase, partial [Eubacteriales bacterium]|nr:metallophosphoesterase [Eubacteriales bacterium]